MILLDSNFIFALKAKRDKNYNRANEILDVLIEEKNDIISTNYLVLNETFTLAISRYNGKVEYIKEYYKLFWGSENFFQLISIEMNENKEIYSILEKYISPKRQLSFVDGSLIYLYKKNDAKQIISFDSHFDNILNRLF